jgi:preprotein translocase subunit SecA
MKGTAGPPFGPEIAAIALHEPALTELEEGGLRERAAALREHFCLGRTVVDDPARLELFALVREAARRRLGLRLFDEQLAAGLALDRGAIAEMATGEGKTLAAVAPVILQAFEGRGTHVLTFNDYLARRDAAWMGPVYELVGVSVGVVQGGLGRAERRRAYQSDVTYLTARESGFDLLRDGLCLELADQVHRPFHSALVDEADSILVDEARVPLVIAGSVEPAGGGLTRFAEIARELIEGVELATDEARRNVFLTDAGVERVEALLGGQSLFSEAGAPLMAAMRYALHAEVLLTRDVDYIVRGAGIELVDRFTGRVAEDRQWPSGLHAAVEAKEGLGPGAEGWILGSITLQHLLALYPRLCGMTATAAPAADELLETYGLEIEPIPPHRPSRRHDFPDHIYATQQARERAVADEIAATHGLGRPVLVGTASVAASERLAKMLAERSVPCRTLNAKNDELEAAIVAEAGAYGAVTVSTNMAGRGTDIRLGGHDERDRERVLALGGLYVVGTCLHESRRIDDQLRGRSGRQGDPGSSRFFVALDDEVPSRCGFDRLLPAVLRGAELAAERPEPIELERVRRELDHAQQQVEGEGFDLRRRLHAYSRVLEEQRVYLQGWRQAVLEATDDDDLIRERCPDLWAERLAQLGEDGLRSAERRLTLLAIDHAWGEHLTEMQARRDELPLATLDGRDPVSEYFRGAIASFEALLPRIDELRSAAFRDLRVTERGIDWGESGLQSPSATWTYLVNDAAFAGDVLRTLAHRPGFGLWGVLLLWPLLFAWGLYLRRRRRRDAPVLR